MTDRNDNSLRALHEIAHAIPNVRTLPLRLRDSAGFIAEIGRGRLCIGGERWRPSFYQQLQEPRLCSFAGVPARNSA